MNKLSIPRQILLLVLAAAGVTILVSAVSYGTLKHSLGVSSKLHDASVSQLSRSYALLSSLSAAQGTLQFLLRQKDPEEIEKALAQVEASRKQAEELIQGCGDSGQALQTQFLALTNREKAVVEQVLLGNGGLGYEQFLAAYIPQYEAVLKEVRLYQDAVEQTAQAEQRTLQTRIRRLILQCAAGVGIALVGLLALSWWMRRRVASNLTGVATKLTSASGQLASASAQISASSQSLAEGASEQAASLEETSSSLEEMASMTRRNADNAQQANTLAQEARQAADTGASDMTAMAAAMGDIKTSSDDIAKIIKTIDEIAFQTNILALNAAVEAARAGEAGMGFAVVADEVRNLAQRSAQAAKETAAKIEGAIGKTAQGVEISERVGRSLQQILGRTRQVAELVAEVAAASREQSQGIEQVNTAVTQMDKVTQGNAANAEESASAAAELNAQAGTLKSAVTELLVLVEGRVPTAPGRSAPQDSPPAGAGNPMPAARARTNGRSPSHSPLRRGPAPKPVARELTPPPKSF